MIKESIQTPVEYWGMGCQVSTRGQGLALRGVFVLVLVPLGIYVLWKRRRK